MNVCLGAQAPLLEKEITAEEPAIYILPVAKHAHTTAPQATLAVQLLSGLLLPARLVGDGALVSTHGAQARPQSREATYLSVLAEKHPLHLPKNFIIH